MSEQLRPASEVTGHVPTVEPYGSRFRAACSCGWRAKTGSVTETLASDRAGRHATDAGRTCGKVRFETRYAAETALAAAKLKNWSGWPKRHERRSYFCEPCGAWHLTSQPERARPAS